MQGNGNHGSPSTTNKQNETQSKNLELLISILHEYSASELENDIFTLHEVAQAKGAKLKRKESKESSASTSKQQEK